VATYVVLLGPPGVGKGTQAKILAEQTGLLHISSGDLFRDNIRNGTELGQLAKSYMDRGELVPDDLTVSMVRARVTGPDSQAGAILDGFPRTPAQAEALRKMLLELHADIDLVPLIKADSAVLVQRLSERWICRDQGHIYNQRSNPPRRPGKCDLDGSELYQREDDKADTVAHRIQVYLDQTAPLIEYYRARQKLIEIDGTQPIEDVSRSLLTVLKKAVG